MRCSRSFPVYAGQSSRMVVLPDPAVAEHQIEIWCSPPPSLVCSVNDAVNVLPCATWPTVTVDPSNLSRTTLAVRPPAGYGSGDGGWPALGLLLAQHSCGLSGSPGLPL